MGLFGKKTKKGALLESEGQAQAAAATSTPKRTTASSNTNKGTAAAGGNDSGSDSSYEKVNNTKYQSGQDLATISSSASSMNSAKLENEIKEIYDKQMGESSEQTGTQVESESTYETYDDGDATEQTEDQTYVSEDDDETMETSKSKGEGDDDADTGGVFAAPYNAVTGAIDNTRAAGLFVQNQAEKLKTRAQQGPLPFSILAFLGGLAMIVINFIDLIFEIRNISPMTALMSVYCIIFGVLTVKIEGRRWELDTTQLPRLYNNFGLLKYVWGRGWFYIFAGTIEISKMQIDDLIVGCYFCFIGLGSLLVGRGTANKLKELSSALDDKQVVLEKFMKYDKDDDGFISYEEFTKMIKHLGMELDHNELDVALFTIDQDQDDKISYDEFLAWWEGFHDSPSKDEDEAKPWSMV